MAEARPPTNYDGTLGIGQSITITPPGEGATVVNVLDLIDCTPPQQKAKQVKWTPQSGDLGGLEQVKAGSEEATQVSMTIVYSKVQHPLIQAAYKVNGAAIKHTLADGAYFSGTGVLCEINVEQITDGKIMQTQLVFALSAGGWQYHAAAPA